MLTAAALQRICSPVQKRYAIDLLVKLTSEAICKGTLCTGKAYGRDERQQFAFASLSHLEMLLRPLLTDTFMIPFVHGKDTW